MVIMGGQMTAGLYRKGNWAFVLNTDASRLAITREQYEAAGCRPTFDQLLDEEDYHQLVLSRKYGDPPLEKLAARPASRPYPGRDPDKAPGPKV